MGGVSSNLHAIFFEIDDVLTKNEKYKNSFEINLGPPNKAKIKGCSLINAGEMGGTNLRPYNGGGGKIDLYGIHVEGECDDIDDRILDNEKYFSTCFLVPKDLKIKDDGGKDISDKCSLVYKTEIQCEGDDTGEIVENKIKNKYSGEIVENKIKNNDTGETVKEPFTNLKNDNNDIFCIFIATIILALFITIKRKNF